MKSMYTHDQVERQCSLRHICTHICITYVQISDPTDTGTLSCRSAGWGSVGAESFQNMSARMIISIQPVQSSYSWCLNVQEANKQLNDSQLPGVLPTSPAPPSAPIGPQSLVTMETPVPFRHHPYEALPSALEFLLRLIPRRLIYLSPPLCLFSNY